MDQILFGWHGKVSLELMAMGRPVVCYLNDEWVTRYRPDLPIINANPHNLVEVLRKTIEDDALRERLSREGVEYVQRYHDVERIMDQCLEIYASCGAGCSKRGQ